MLRGKIDKLRGTASDIEAMRKRKEGTETALGRKLARRSGTLRR